MILLSVYFLIFGVVGSIYIDTINETKCKTEKNMAELCLFMTFCISFFIPFGSICCLTASSDPILTNSHHSEGACKDCGSFMTAIALLMHIIFMGLSVEIYKEDCSREMGTIFVIEAFTPISSFVFLMIFLMFYGCVHNMKNNKVYPAV